MAIVYESKHFLVEAVDNPHIDRDEGGHIVIYPRTRLVDRQQLPPRQAIELMRLTIVVGQAMTVVMNQHGVDVDRINYQDNGNWGVSDPKGPSMHIHLYGRARSATVQKYGEACFFPNIDSAPEFYLDLNPLNKHDIRRIAEEVGRMLKEEKYVDSAWRLP